MLWQRNRKWKWKKKKFFPWKETHQNCCNLLVVVVVVGDVEASDAQSMMLGALKGNTNWVESYQLGYRLGSLPRSPRDYSFVKKICKNKRRKQFISFCWCVFTLSNNLFSNSLFIPQLSLYQRENRKTPTVNSMKLFLSNCRVGFTWNILRNRARSVVT